MLNPAGISDYLHYKFWVEALTHSQTPTVVSFNFGNWWAISPNDLRAMLALKLFHIDKIGPSTKRNTNGYFSFRETIATNFKR